jgi:hypothetical protein
VAGAWRCRPASRGRDRGRARRPAPTRAATCTAPLVSSPRTGDDGDQEDDEIAVRRSREETVRVMDDAYRGA